MYESRITRSSCLSLYASVFFSVLKPQLLTVTSQNNIFLILSCQLSAITAHASMHVVPCVAGIFQVLLQFSVVDLTQSGAEKPNPDPPNHLLICLGGGTPWATDCQPDSVCLTLSLLQDTPCVCDTTQRCHIAQHAVNAWPWIDSEYHVPGIYKRFRRVMMARYQ